MAKRFEGFRSPNYTQVPDEFFDELMADLGLGEIKVLLYVMRRTFGFKKGSDRISKSQLENGITRGNGEQLDSGTGLSRRAIRIAVQNLVARNVLLKRTQSSREKGHEATEYALNIIGRDPWVPSTPGGGVRSTQALGSQVPPQHTDKQKTERHTRVSSLPVKKPLSNDAAELVTYFHTKAGHPAAQKPTAKELTQAHSLLADHGIDRSRAIVNFALARARETNFPVRYLGGVLAYVPEALEALSHAEQRRLRERAKREQEALDDATRQAERDAIARLPRDERVGYYLRRSVSVFESIRRRSPTELELAKLEKDAEAAADRSEPTYRRSAS